jgi:sphingolipid delta-4 desaturase
MYQGTDGVDMDIATDIEAKVIGHNPVTKFLFVLFQSLFYALRPVLVRPKTPGAWEFANYAVIVTSNFLIYHYIGGRALGYLGLSSFFGHGLNACAGHFISEHYVFSPLQETYR